MNKNQRQAILLLGFMVLLSAVFVYLFVHGPGAEERSILPEFSSPDINETIEAPEIDEDEDNDIPILGDIIDGWRQLIEDMTQLT